MKYPNASEWPVKDLLNAISTYKTLGDQIAEHASMALIAGQPAYEYDLDKGDIGRWTRLADEFRETLTEDEFERFVQSIEVVLEIGIDMLTVYRDSFRKSGLLPATLPDPATIQIPDSADDIDW